jgi:transcriptional regulator with XRE-family HTH domain
MEPDKLSIGERIRTLREKDFKLSRQKFAENCDISENHMGRIERGEMLISTILLNKLCNVYGVSSDYILFGKEEKSRTRKNLDGLLDRATEEELETYLRMVALIKGII